MNGVLVVVPTYLEAANIETVLTRIRAALPDAEVLIVDDDSADGTAALAQGVGERLGGISVLSRSVKDGLGNACRAGFAWGLERGFDLLVSMDADLSHDPAALPDLVAAARDGADLVIGSRYVPGGSIRTGWPWYRKALSRWANVYIRLALGTSVIDNTTGYRVYSADLVRRIRFNDSRADGYAFEIEAVYRSNAVGAVIREVPIVFTDRAAGQSKLSSRTVVEALMLVTRWGLRNRTGRGRVDFDPARKRALTTPPTRQT